MDKLNSSIKERNKQKTLDILNNRLEYFVKNLLDIEREIKSISKTNEQLLPLLQIEYYRKWKNDVNNIPIPHIDKHISPISQEENLKMSSLLSRKELPLTKYNDTLTYAIIQYVIYIYSKERLAYSEIIKWRVLYLLGGVYNLTVVCLPLNTILKTIDRIISENKIERPTMCYYEGVMYDHQLSSSEKGAIHRIAMLQKLVNAFIVEYKNQHNGYYPHRVDIKDYLKEYIANNVALKRVYPSLNPRTMAKIMKGYTNLLSK